MKTKKALGQRGSWFAVVDGETLPCVHRFWWKSGSYNDTDIRSTPKSEELVEAIRKSRRVILTQGIPIYDGDGKVIGSNRTGYVAIYAVDEIEFDDAGLRFKFTKRLDELV